MLNDKKTIEENNIEAETTIEMSLRVSGGMGKDGLMNTTGTEEEREQKRKLEELCEGKSIRPSEDAVPRDNRCNQKTRRQAGKLLAENG